jgi:hypothetical protein
MAADSSGVSPNRSGVSRLSPAPVGWRLLHVFLKLFRVVDVLVADIAFHDCPRQRERCAKPNGRSCDGTLLPSGVKVGGQS